MGKTDKREDILDAAIALFAEQGFHGAPMALIAKRAGVGTGTIYRYFENRDILINALFMKTYEAFENFILKDYPVDRPVRERFFHICKGAMAYYINHPLEHRYNEQFHNSPYGQEHRRKKLLAASEDYDFFRTMFVEGRAQQVIKDIPLPIYIDLSFAPIVWALRDHFAGVLTLDDGLMDIIVTACWDSIKL